MPANRNPLRRDRLLITTPLFQPPFNYFAFSPCTFYEPIQLQHKPAGKESLPRWFLISINKSFDEKLLYASESVKRCAI